MNKNICKNWKKSLKVDILGFYKEKFLMQFALLKKKKKKKNWFFD